MRLVRWPVQMLVRLEKSALRYAVGCYAMRDVLEWPPHSPYGSACYALDAAGRQDLTGGMVMERGCGPDVCRCGAGTVDD